MTPVPLTARAAGWVIFILALGAGFSVAQSITRNRCYP